VPLKKTTTKQEVSAGPSVQKLKRRTQGGRTPSTVAAPVSGTLQKKEGKFRKQKKQKTRVNITGGAQKKKGKKTHGKEGVSWGG